MLLNRYRPDGRCMTHLEAAADKAEDAVSVEQNLSHDLLSPAGIIPENCGRLDWNGPVRRARLKCFPCISHQDT